MGVEEPFTKEAIIYAEQRVEQSIFNALKHTGKYPFSIKTFSDALNELPIVTLDFDFAKVVAHNDKAMDLHGSQVSPHELPHIAVAQNKVLEHPEGGAIEDRNGTLFAIHGRVPQGRCCIHSAEVVSLSFILAENSSEKAYDIGGGDGEDNDKDDIPNWVGPWDVTSDQIQINDFTADRLLESDGGFEETLDLRELWNFDLLNI